ncbi:hypothetical protein OGAPHI_003811 [Ogataea philodendri]|uniref:Uncharacterized protein n=1 Tax=Ogataea philodendri TaxID=1378263 RepID=A0A9P8P519_9ASCO|nr:uncharacterized protein OGAPHI_003811 [Ogataea philodendri]KAH3665623.1 hypothetical protein OGAPHI_003811 [Ogataea philodendri]
MAFTIAALRTPSTGGPAVGMVTSSVVFSGIGMPRQFWALISVAYLVASSMLPSLLSTIRLSRLRHGLILGFWMVCVDGEQIRSGEFCFCVGEFPGSLSSNSSWKSSWCMSMTNWLSLARRNLLSSAPKSISPMSSCS